MDEDGTGWGSTPPSKYGQPSGAMALIPSGLWLIRWVESAEIKKGLAKAGMGGDDDVVTALLTRCGQTWTIPQTQWP